MRRNFTHGFDGKAFAQAPISRSHRGSCVGEDGFAVDRSTGRRRARPRPRRHARDRLPRRHAASCGRFARRARRPRAAWPPTEPAMSKPPLVAARQPNLRSDNRTWAWPPVVKTPRSHARAPLDLQYLRHSRRRRRAGAERRRRPLASPAETRAALCGARSATRRLHATRARGGCRRGRARRRCGGSAPDRGAGVRSARRSTLRVWSPTPIGRSSARRCSAGRTAKAAPRARHTAPPCRQPPPPPRCIESGRAPPLARAASGRFVAFRASAAHPAPRAFSFSRRTRRRYTADERFHARGAVSAAPTTGGVEEALTRSSADDRPRARLRGGGPPSPRRRRRLLRRPRGAPDLSFFLLLKSSSTAARRPSACPTAGKASSRRSSRRR